MDLAKTGELISHSSIFSDSFGYIAKTIVGVGVLIQLDFLYYRDYLLLQISFFKSLDFYGLIFITIIIFLLALFTGVIHLVIFDGVIYLTGSILQEINKKASIFIEFLIKKSKHFLVLKRINDYIYRLVQIPIFVYYGIPLLGGLNNLDNRVLLSKITKRFEDYFDMQALSYSTIDYLSEALVNQSKIQMKNHIHDFQSSLIRGAVVIGIYFAILNVQTKNLGSLPYIGLAILILLLKNRYKTESERVQTLSNAFIILNLKRLESIKDNTVRT